MPTVSFRVSEDLKEKMDARDEINWSAVLRRQIEEEIAELEGRNVAHAVATSERLSQQIDEDDVAEENTAEVIREFRDARYGDKSAR
jgi:transcription initiation factor TFIIIB Brf1 subunit/transcription initiation factor TFIIB